MTNKEVRELIKDHIHDFSSKEIQYEAWFIRKKIISTPNEDYCMLFDDWKIEKYVYAKDNYLTRNENNELKELIDMLNNYGNKHRNSLGFLELNPEIVYYDEEWGKIRKQAELLYKLLSKEEGLENLKIVENWTY